MPSSCKKIMANDPQVLEDLIHTYFDALVRYAYCYTGGAAAAEDVVEDAYACLVARGLSFESLSQIRAWLYKTVRSRAVDYLRRHKKEVPLEDVQAVLSAADAAQAYEAQEQKHILYTTMQTLPRQYREVLVLRYFDDFSVQEVARILRKNAKQVYNLLNRAKNALKESLLKEGFFYEEL